MAITKGPLMRDCSNVLWYNQQWNTLKPGEEWRPPYVVTWKDLQGVLWAE